MTARQRRGPLQGLPRFVRGQLAVFLVLTVIGVVVMAAVYVQLPAMVGIGRYQVTVRLAASGGLYPHANVTYRGSNIGKVTDLHLTPDGVDATLSIDSDRTVPADVRAAVRSVSAIGEQYVDLVPTDTAGSGRAPALSNGTVIPVEHTSLPPDVGPLLDQSDRLLAGLGKTRLRTVIDEAFRAFDGSGPDLQRFLDSAHLLVQEADAASGPTKALIDQVGPLLDTQLDSSDAIRAWTKDLARVTDQIRAKDPQLRAVLDKSPGAIDVTTATFRDLRPTLPLLLANLVSVGQVSTTYLPGTEQILVIFPPLIRALMQSLAGGPLDQGAMVDFFLETNDPPACTTGFLPKEQWRSPALLDTPPTPDNLFCKVGPNSPIAVRGVHNMPCMEVPGKRAPSPEACRNGLPYRPATNPPFGAPQPDPNPGTGVQPSSYRPATAARPYDPGTGIFIGTDGRTYSQPGVAPGGGARTPKDWKTLMTDQQGR